MDLCKHVTVYQFENHYHFLDKPLSRPSSPSILNNLKPDL